jgi:hypothetical protein
MQEFRRTPAGTPLAFKTIEHNFRFGVSIYAKGTACNASDVCADMLERLDQKKRPFWHT